MVARVLLSGVLLLAVACGGDTPGPGVAGAAGRASGTAPATQTVEPGALRPSEGFDVSQVVFTDDDERITMPVLVADDPSLRATGLMGRAELPDDAGMLFVFDAPTAGAFWMKDTPLPLSIAFVSADGEVQQVLDMEPCAADPCPRYQPEDTYLYAVEANQGYFAARDIGAGWVLEIDGRRGGAR